MSGNVQWHNHFKCVENMDIKVGDDCVQDGGIS